MDGVAATAAISGLAMLCIQIVKFTKEYTEDVRDAPKAIQKLP
jgi:hypothetical protein